MYITHTIRTTYGPRSLGRRPLIRVHLTPAELHAVIRHIEAEAAAAAAEGREAAADALAWRLAALREASR